MQDVTIYHSDCLEVLRSLPDACVTAVLTSPPYNVGKQYEKRMSLDDYISCQKEVIGQCYRVLSAEGSIFWQVGNYVEKGEVFPLDTLFYPIFKQLGLKLRNRIVWHFRHGLHCAKRLSGRYETVLWFTKTDNYIFNLDAIRVPQLYTNKKAYKGPNRGKPTCHPLGKNPGDVWDIPNVKHNHPEKTPHPCQFPEELAERIIKAASNEGDLILDPFLGSGTTLVVARRLGRRAIGSEINEQYIALARRRLDKIPLPLFRQLQTQPPAQKPLQLALP